MSDYKHVVKRVEMGAAGWASTVNKTSTVSRKVQQERLFEVEIKNRKISAGKRSAVSKTCAVS